MSSDLFVATTFRCNLKCAYCYNDTHFGVAEGYKSRTSGDISQTVVIKILEEFIRCRYSTLILTGGEPLLAPITTTWLFEGSQRKVPTNLITNLSLMSPRHASLLARHQTLTVTISIGGADEQSHDALRGRFRQTYNNALRLAEAGVKLVLSVVLDARNILSIPAFERMAEELSASIHYAPISVPKSIDFLRERSLEKLCAEDWEKAMAACTTKESLKQLSMVKGFYMGTLQVRSCGMRTKSQVLDPWGNLKGCFFRDDIDWGNVTIEEPAAVFSRVPREQMWDAGCFGGHCIPLHYR